MNYTSKQYARALWEILEKKPPQKRREAIDNFLRVLKNKKDFKKINFIVKEFEKIFFTKKRVLKAEITSPFPLAKKSAAQIKKFILSFFKERPNSLFLEQKIDKNLIGGFQIKSGDYLIDSSVKNILSKLGRGINY